jgi:regulatory protein YycI of two-component signal transduction system YycFG
MTDSLFFQIFIILNVFIMGILVAIAARHAYAHFHPTSTAEPEKPHPARPTYQAVHLSPEVKQRLLQSAQANFQTVLNRTATELQRDLKSTATQLNIQMKKIGNDVVNNETKRYQVMLEDLRLQAETAIRNSQSEIGGHEAELKAKLDEKMAAEEQRLLQQIDTKLGDAVASFLLETLQHNVDLGAQSAYLTATLDQHKADFTREVSHEAPTTK